MKNFIDNLTDKKKKTLIGLIIFWVLSLFFYVTNIDAYFLLSVYVIGFWIYLIYLDIRYRKRMISNSELDDNPSVLELKNFCNIWKLLKYGCQLLGFGLLLIGFLFTKEMGNNMIVGVILVSLSLLFDSMYDNDVDKITEIYNKEVK